MTPVRDNELQQHAEEEWRELAERYLPVMPAKGGWRYSRGSAPDEPQQGWKLHVSAASPDAMEIFRLCAPYLAGTGVLFKAARSMGILAQLNSAIPFGFSQIGKFMTVYPATDDQAVEIAEELHRLTAAFGGPSVPFDEQFKPGSRIFYRYGAFGPQEMTLEDGTSVGAITGPDGQLTEDRREPGQARPDWVPCPFPLQEPSAKEITPLQRDYLCYEAMMQRGKGGVYRAVQLASDPVRLCVLKEGRRHGETGWDGLDGHRLVQREEDALRFFRQAGVDVPAVLDGFEVEGHRYLVMEHLDGESLHMGCSDPEQRLPIDVALGYAEAAAAVVAQIHGTGWVWRDCKPANLIVSGSVLRPVDFEGASGPGHEFGRSWGTPGYIAPEARKEVANGHPDAAEDLYSLGGTIHQLLTSWLMHAVDADGDVQVSGQDRPALGRLRKGVPAHVRSLVAALMHAEPAKRPSAASAVEELAPYRLAVLPKPGLPAKDSRTVRRVRQGLMDDVRDMVFKEHGAFGTVDGGAALAVQAAPAARDRQMEPV